MAVHAEKLVEVVIPSGDALRARLSAKVAMYEAQYQIPSIELRTAIEGGRLTDTLDVCDWLIAWEALDALGRGGPTRLE